MPSLSNFQVRGGPQKGLLAFSLHGTDGKSRNPLNQSLIPELRRRRENMDLPEPWICPDFSSDISLSQLPRQALSLLFDTYHNEVDAFLLADVSTNSGAGPVAPNFFLPLLQSSWDQ